MTSDEHTVVYRIFLVVLLLPLILMTDVKPVSANTIHVTISYDEEEDNSDCSLREAIIAAKFDIPHYGCPAGSGKDVIMLGSGTYTVDKQLDSISNDITISGSSPEATIIQASSCNPIQDTCTNDHMLFWVSHEGTLFLQNLTIRNGKNIGDLNGGVIYSEGTVILLNSNFTNNRGAYGGVIVNNQGTLDISQCTFSANMAGNTGGLMSGGVIRNTLTGMVTIEESTFSGNNAENGGAIHNYGTLTVVNSTFSDNGASNQGGAIHNEYKLTVTNSTFADNSALSGAGIYNDGSMNMINTLIANSTDGGDCYDDGTIITQKNNLIEDGSCGEEPSADPALKPLDDYGGPTQTHALESISLAIDAGDTAACPATDQRGVDRPQGEGCDIGAYEFEYTYIYLPMVTK